MSRNPRFDFNIFTFVWIVTALVGAAASYLAFRWNWPMQTSVDWVYFVLVFGIGVSMFIMSLLEIFKRRKRLRITEEGLHGLENEVIPWIIVQEIRFNQNVSPCEMIVTRYDNPEPRTYVLDKGDPVPEAIRASVQKLAPQYSSVIR